MRIAAKNSFLYLVILLFLILPSQFLMLKTPIFPSQDGLYHIERIRQFDQSVKLVKIPPRLAPSLYGGIGYPLFVVNYQLPYYETELFMLIFNNPFIAFKAVMSISYILSVVFTFFLFRGSGGNFASLSGAILFAYLPYRFADLYSRGSLGESAAIMFVPLILLSLNHINKRYGVLLLAASIFGLITSHTVIFMLFIPFFIMYGLFFVKPNRNNLVKIALGFFLGLLLSSFQLLPAIFDKQYLKFDQNLSGLYTGHFFSFAQMARIPLPGVNTGTPFQIGLAGTIVFLLGLVALAGKRSKEVIFFLAVIIIALFLTQKQSLWFWQNLPVVSYILYPWRFLSVVIISVSFLTVYLVERFKFGKLLGIFLIAFVIFTSRHYFLKPTQFVSSLPSASTTTANEYDTIWTNSKTFETRPTVSGNGNFTVRNLKENGLDLSFVANVSKPSTLSIRRMYFPGWKILINNKEAYANQIDGLISFPLEPGAWKIDVSFHESAIRLASDLLTLSSGILLFTALILTIGKNRKGEK